MSARSLGIRGVRVGHWTDSQAETGCTVVALPEGTVCSYEVRGGAPASRELELLGPDKTVSRADAVLLTGGSAFGLAAADGVMRYLEETSRGVPTPAGRVPIVPAMALFDLGVGDGNIRPQAAHGYLAAKATRGPQVLSGRVGAGAGAYVGHWRGQADRRPAGLASHVICRGALVVAALCAVNAFGDIDPGTSECEFGWIDLFEQSLEASAPLAQTIIGVVCTNARLDKPGCQVVAQGAHDGLSRAVTPPHTRFDGDAFIAAATGEVEASIDVVRFLALTAVCRAIRSLAATEPPKLLSLGRRTVENRREKGGRPGAGDRIDRVQRLQVVRTRRQPCELAGRAEQRSVRQNQEHQPERTVASPGRARRPRFVTIRRGPGHPPCVRDRDRRAVSRPAYSTLDGLCARPRKDYK